MASCINLKQRFGRRYRVVHEESYKIEKRRGDCPELMILQCRFGHIFPHGDEMLAASVDGHPRIAARLRELEACEVIQEGDFGEITVIFDVAHFDAVAEILRPRRRKVLSERERLRLLGMGFQTKAGKPHGEEQYSDRHSVSGGQSGRASLAGQMPLF